ncbi:hypothetical protein COO60DRAFT_413583 [Scenedesmus sp. NREL 46B-D3]|nr:hypothetical protein COO60DRAFT_413583 [Scenedesmus sp. NREL 46B-D3]
MKQHGQRQQLSAFELQRQHRIAENKAKMLEIGVDDARDQLLATRQAEKQTKAANKPKPQRNAKPAEPARRSERNAGREPPDYRGKQELAVFVSRQVRPRAPGRERTEGKQRHSSSRYPSWHMGIPDAPMAAIEEAHAAAAALAEQLTVDGTPAYIKAMTDSMVARGGWLQAPSQLQHHYCADSDITFTTLDTTRPASDFRFTQFHRREGDGRKDAWTVGYLKKKDLKTGIPKGGYGLSKNWKGFAADQFLHPGDSIVIQVTGPFEAVLHIFRAWDYASEASKPEGFDAIRFSRAAVVGTSGDDGDAAAGAQQQGGAAAAEEEGEAASEEEDAEAGSAAGDDGREQQPGPASAALVPSLVPARVEMHSCKRIIRSAAHARTGDSSDSTLVS